MSRSVEPEQRLAEALRARATGAGRAGPNGPAPRGGADPDTAAIRAALLAALAVGLLVGVLFALLSLLSPGTLPPLG
ncbi:hypothetical protein [Pseudonocardia humida]|uniref:Uncharacterized protein n=1 Tax=Pseudonocardia humida TaxID=2800819 RepID=A0ABT0ZXC2_9PSEU|nr:hypothetical protein [Pseudonocardia humida]MCO1655371.1 hypothetical protein [Pseudonocardia humida]